MVLKSYAKVNLSLLVSKKLKNGLHNIQSSYCLIDLSDEISIKTNNKLKDKISFKGPHANNLSRSNNSIQKVLHEMRKNKLISNFYNISVYKKIPVFGGLGGGSSNAATILKFLVKKKIKKEIINKFVNIVGSDLRLFFHKQGFLKNIKTVKKFNKKFKLDFLLIYPKIKCSTKEIYSKVKKYSKKELFIKKNHRSKTTFIHDLVNSKNDLQLVVEKKHPIIKKLLKSIRNTEGCHFARMSGSGSTCYGLFLNKSCSLAALKKLRRKYPKFWFSIAKSI